MSKEIEATCLKKATKTTAKSGREIIKMQRQQEIHQKINGNEKPSKTQKSRVRNIFSSKTSL